MLKRMRYNRKSHALLIGMKNNTPLLKWHTTHCWAGFGINKLDSYVNLSVSPRPKWLVWCINHWHAETELSMPMVTVEACNVLWHCDISEDKVTPHLRTLNLTHKSRAITPNLRVKTDFSLRKDFLLGISLFHFHTAFLTFTAFDAAVSCTLLHEPCFDISNKQWLVWRSQNLNHKSFIIPRTLYTVLLWLLSFILYHTFMQKIMRLASHIIPQRRRIYPYKINHSLIINRAIVIFGIYPDNCKNYIYKYVLTNIYQFN